MTEKVFHTVILEDLAFIYLEHTIRWEGWHKAETHERLCKHIAQYLDIDPLLNYDLIYIAMREWLTDDLTGTIGLKWQFVTRRQMRGFAKKFVKRLEQLLPFIQKHATAEEDENWILRKKEILGLCDAELKHL